MIPLTTVIATAIAALAISRCTINGGRLFSMYEYIIVGRFCAVAIVGIVQVLRLLCYSTGIDDTHDIYPPYLCLLYHTNTNCLDFVLYPRSSQLIFTWEVSTQDRTMRTAAWVVFTGLWSVALLIHTYTRNTIAFFSKRLD